MRLLPQLSGPNRAISVLTGAPRFLQANKGSVEEAAAHFRRMLAWYREAVNLVLVVSILLPKGYPGQERAFLGMFQREP